MQVFRFSRFVLFGEWKMLLTTRQEDFRFVLFDEWKILCSIRHIVFSIRKLHLVSDNAPLQVCRSGRFVLFDEWKIWFTTWQLEFRFVRFDHPWRLRRIQGIIYRVVKYSSSLCACYYSLRTELCQYIVHSFCRQFTFHADRFQLKREISRTMTFCLYYAVTFVERYEKTTWRFCSVCF